VRNGSVSSIPIMLSSLVMRNAGENDVRKRKKIKNEKAGEIKEIFVK
jgi:hypothetical protein